MEEVKSLPSPERIREIVAGIQRAKAPCDEHGYTGMAGQNWRDARLRYYDELEVAALAWCDAVKRIEKLEALCEEAAVELSEVAKMMPNPGWYGQSVRMRAVAARLRAVDLPKTREMISDEAARLRAKGERG